MKRFAFTMLELVFVIIVIGILAVLAMPNFTTNPLQQAAEQVASHIRYTQHLAMVDDKYDPSDENWARTKWQLEFKRVGSPGAYTSLYYEVYSDMDKGGNSDVTTHKESATDPLSGLLLDGITNATELTNYGITNISMTASCRDSSSTAIGEISFDNLGRPHFYVTSTKPPASNINQYLLLNDCNITLTHDTEGNATITIRPETGYVSITYN